MTHDTPAMVYLGPPGSGLGFRMSGVTVAAVASSEALVAAVRHYKEAGVQLLFADEGLAAPVLDELERLTEDPLPALVLVPDPIEPKQVTQTKMNNLMIRAVGSDILGQS